MADRATAVSAEPVGVRVVWAVLLLSVICQSRRGQDDSTPSGACGLSVTTDCGPRVVSSLPTMSRLLENYRLPGVPDPHGRCQESVMSPMNSVPASAPVLAGLVWLEQGRFFNVTCSSRGERNWVGKHV